MVKKNRVMKSIASIFVLLTLLISSQASANNWPYLSALAEVYLDNPKVKMELGEYYLQKRNYGKAREYFWQVCDSGFKQGCDEYSRLKKIDKRHTYSDHKGYRDEQRYFKSEKEWKKEQKERKKYEKEMRKEAKKREKERKRFKKDLNKMIDDGLDGKVDKVLKRVIENL